jgi:hypothetical protein
MRELFSDAGVLFSSHACGNLLGIVLSYVDDLIITGYFEFLEKSRAIHRRFKSRPIQTNMFTHARVDIRREQNLTSLIQTGYANEYIACKRSAITKRSAAHGRNFSGS